MRLKEIAKRLGLEVKGGSDALIEGVGDIERLADAESLRDDRVYFIESAAVLKRHPQAAQKGAVLTTPALADQFQQALIAPEGAVRLAFIKLLALFDKTPVFPPQISPAAQIHPAAKIAASAAVLAGAVVMEGAAIGENCILYPGVVIEPFAEIGDETVLYPNVVIGHHCVIGKNCVIHACAVIGADGFGFYDHQGQRHKIPQIGNVLIADDVEIGASSTVDRASIESTRIGAHTKMDDQVHVGHNAQLGKYIYISGNSAIGGSTIVEDGSMISGMVIIKDHLHIAKGTIVMGMSGVAQDTEAGAVYFGTPARPARQTHKMHAAMERLPELIAKVRELESKIGALTS